MIRDHLDVIRQGRRSGMKAWLAKPTFIVGKPTWNHSELWYASAIAHDAYHAKLFRDAERSPDHAQTKDDVWTGATAERHCLEFQGRVLRRLGADEKLLGYIAACQASPTYHGHNRGWRSWLDYLQRWW